MSSRLRRLLPILVAVSALAFVASRTDLHRLQTAMAHAPLLELALVSALSTGLTCAADTLATVSTVVSSEGFSTANSAPSPLTNLPSI